MTERGGVAKRQSESEFRRWHAEGMPYREMQRRYREQYNIETSLSMFTTWAMRLQLPKRARAHRPVSYWDVKDEHTKLAEYGMLLALAREEDGMPLSADIARRLATWKEELSERGWVLYYDPLTEEGFFYTDRTPADGEFIARPRDVG